MTSKLKKFAPYLIFIAAMLWATDAPFRVYLTREFPSSFIVLMEHLIDVIIVLPVMFMVLGQLKNLRAKHWLAVLVIAVGGSALATFAFTQAFHYVNPSVAILLQKLQPLIAISLAATILREQLSKRFWLWALLALAGAYLISFSGIVPQLYSGEQFNPNFIGVSLALVAAVLWGASTVLGKYALAAVDFKLMTGLRFVIAFAFLLLWNAKDHQLGLFTTLHLRDWLFFAIIAITSGVVSLFVYYYALQYTKASIATVAELGFPLAAVVVNAIFLKATLTPAQLIGMAVLLFAIFQLSKVNLINEGNPRNSYGET